MRSGVVLGICLVAGALAGCMSPTGEYYEFDPDAQYRNPGVFEGRYAGMGTSRVLVQGTMLPSLVPELVRLVSDRPAYNDVFEVEDSEARVDISMAIWRPFNHTEPVPIIVDAGPYFEVGCRPTPRACVPLTIDMQSQTTPFNFANFIPHGYAVVQLAVRGTGTSGGCMDLMGPDEQHDLDQAITWLGQQPWSNGRIAMVGASYDGSTPWIVAATGNPYLKTIVPTSGLPDIYDLMFHNGSAETRGPIMHNQVYWGYGFSSDFPQRPSVVPSQVPWLPPAGVGQANGRAEYQDRQNLMCPEIVEASAMGQWATHNGDRGEEFSTYWAERDHRPGVLQNYKGSVFLVHGLQDWNVDPHAAIPFNQQLRDAGIEMKEWYGQWGHAFPDSNCMPAADWVVMPCRLDFAEVLHRWFERHLKGDIDIDIGPPIQIQDNLGFWRNADSYPPADGEWTPLGLGTDGRLLAQGAAAGDVILAPPGPSGPGDHVQLVSEPLEEELHLSGLPQLRLPFSVQGQGGHIAAWLFDQAPDGKVRAPAAVEVNTTEGGARWLPLGTPVVGHAQMNLRYYAGGEDPQPITPGLPHTARIEFEPLEVRIPAGHRLVLWLFQYHYGDRTDSTTASPVTLHLGPQAVLRLPVVDVDPRDVFPVPGVNFLNRTYVPEMYVPMPDVPAAVPAPGDVMDAVASWTGAETTASKASPATAASAKSQAHPVATLPGCVGAC